MFCLFIYDSLKSDRDKTKNPLISQSFYPTLMFWLYVTAMKLNDPFELDKSTNPNQTKLLASAIPKPRLDWALNDKASAPNTNRASC